MKVKEDSEKAGLNLKEKKKKKKKTMASGSITSLQIDGQKMETVTEFIFLVFKVTTDSDCSHEIKRCSLLEQNLW